ncbi:UNVERIFIED_CONTAM: hypothetical protein FKN15_025397 [Acipenser sinensis]
MRCTRCLVPTATVLVHECTVLHSTQCTRCSVRTVHAVHTVLGHCYEASARVNGAAWYSVHVVLRYSVRTVFSTHGAQCTLEHRHAVLHGTRCMWCPQYAVCTVFGTLRYSNSGTPCWTSLMCRPPVVAPISAGRKGETFQAGKGHYGPQSPDGPGPGALGQTGTCGPGRSPSSIAIPHLPRGDQVGWDEASQLVQEETLSIAASGEGASFSSDMQFKVSPNVVFSGLELIPDSSSDKALDSLGSVEENLGIFQEILSSLPVDNVDQILADIINLQTIIRSLAVSISCTPLKSRNTGHLENFLKNNSTFRFTIGNVALDRLQKYLLKLIRNLDQLKKC